MGGGGRKEKKRKKKLNNDKHHAEKAVTDRKNASPYSRKSGAPEVPTLLWKAAVLFLQLPGAAAGVLRRGEKDPPM